MTPYSPKEYWAGLAGQTNLDASGFAPVLHPNAPPWFNLLIDDLQHRAMKSALALAKIPGGSRALDVGCGTGRWLRRYEGMAFRATGVDVTEGMLRLAQSRGTSSPLVAGESFRLPFADEAFDLVSDVTVVQHVIPAFQAKALEEMMRVLKPGGRLILMELIRGEDTHIFPRKPGEWIGDVTSRGPRLIGWFGQEFLLLDRLFVLLAQTARRKNSSTVQTVPMGSSQNTSRVPLSRRLYWNLRRVTATLSAWTEPITGKVLPASLATHAVFVFEK